MSDQTQASVPTASGAAVNFVTPDAPFNFNPADFTIDLDRLNLVERLLNDTDRGIAMAAMLASIDPDKTDLAAMNASLAAAGIGIALEHRKLKS